MASSWAVSRGNTQAAKEKELLEAGLYLTSNLSDEERCFRESIAANLGDASLRLIFADWLEERGRTDEALTLRLIGLNKAINGTSVYNGWIRKSDNQPAEWDETIALATHRYEKRQLFTPGRWSVVRRITEGANGGHRQHTVRWERVTIIVTRCTKATAFLATGTQIRLNTLTACVPLEPCSCMAEDNRGQVATPSGSCRVHGWTAGKTGE